MLKLISSSFSVLSFSICFSQENAEIETDRPDQTECSSVIPTKSIQLETGIVHESDAGNHTFYAPTSLIRIGVFSGMEFRIIAGEYYIEKMTSDSVMHINEGFSPFSIGTKIFLCKEKKLRPQASLLFHLNHDNSQFLIEKIFSDFRFSMSHTLTDRLDLGYNLGGEWNRQENTFVYIYTLTTAFAISEKLGSYIEIFGDAEKGELPHHQFDGGITFLPRKNLQLDCSAGVAMNKNAPDIFISAGFSWRIPK